MLNEGHSPLGASGAHRWMFCLGQPRMAALAPLQESGPAARRGTSAHKVLELTWPRRSLEPRKPTDFLGAEVLGEEMDEEDIEAIETAIVHLDEESRLIQSEHKIYSEVEFHLSDIHPDLWGTSDVCLAAVDLSVLKIYDYKHGKMPVEVIKEILPDGTRVLNFQLMYYALGAIKKICELLETNILDMVGWGSVFEEVWIGIIQPRCHHDDGPFRKVKVTGKELEDFAILLGEKARATEGPNAPLCPGDWCKWCPALNECGEFTYQKAKEAQVDFRPVSDPINLALPAPQTLSIEQILKVKEFQSVMKDWFKQFDQYLHGLLKSGGVVPGYKLVKKKTNRAYIDEEAVWSAASMVLTDDEIAPRKMRSPAQIEKLIGKKNMGLIAHLIEKPDAGTTVAPVSDPRPEVPPPATEDFDVIEERN